MAYRYTFKNDWFGDSLSQSARCDLSLEKDTINFLALIANGLQSHPHAIPHTVTEDLWKHDVIELFFTGRSGYYLEINLAPNAAWWTQWFSAPRKVDLSLPKIHATTTREQSDSKASSLTLSLKLTDLTPLGEFEYVRWNATYICNSPDQQFASIADLPGKTPDFHQPDHFLPLPQL